MDIDLAIHKLNVSFLVLILRLKTFQLLQDLISFNPQVSILIIVHLHLKLKWIIFFPGLPA